MHELSLARSLIEIVEEYGCREGFAKVRSLKLSCGCLSCVDPEAFRFAFAIEAEGTRAAGAQLEFDIGPAVHYCLVCEREFASPAFRPDCPGCGAAEVLLRSGTEELKLLEMDVD